LVLGVACGLLLYRLVTARIDAGDDAVLLCTVLAVTPVFVIASTTSMDYVYGLAPFLAGWVLLEAGAARPWVAMVFAVSAMSRLSYLPLIVAVICLAPSPWYGRRWRFQCAAIFAALVVVGYLPAFYHANATLRFLGANRPDGQGLLGLFGRVLVKPTLVLGMVGTLAVAALVVLAVRSSRAAARPGWGERWLLVPLALQLLLWIWLPVEPSYLLPALAILIVWLARPTSGRAFRSTLLLLVCALVAYSWVDVPVLRFDRAARIGVGVCGPIEAIGASIDVHVTRGPLLSYPSIVHEYAPCNRQVREDKLAEAREGR
jgi:hypothetical protein